MMITRRLFCASISGLALMAGSAAIPHRFGRVTVSGWIVHRNRTGKELRIILDGRDVTERCVLANDRRQYVVLNKSGPDGKLYIDLHGGIARERIRGNVVISERDVPPRQIKVRPNVMKEFA